MYINKLKKEYIINNDDIEYFLKKWLYFDSEGTGFISPENTIFLIIELKPPLGFGSKLKGIINTQSFHVYEENLDEFFISPTKKTNFNKKNVFRILKIFNIPLIHYNGKYQCHFMHVIRKLLKISMNEKYPNFEPK